MLVLLASGLAGCREPNAPAANGSPQGDAPPAAAATATLCNIEFLADEPFGAEPLPVRAASELRGWLASEDGSVPDNPMLEIVDPQGKAVSLALHLDQPRPDVIQAFPGRVRVETSGFRSTIDPAGLAAGTYHLYLSYFAAARRHTCDNGRQIHIGG